jgi:hypothetical protein
MGSLSTISNANFHASRRGQFASIARFRGSRLSVLSLMHHGQGSAADNPSLICEGPDLIGEARAAFQVLVELLPSIRMCFINGNTRCYDLGSLQSSIRPNFRADQLWQFIDCPAGKQRGQNNRSRERTKGRECIGHLLEMINAYNGDLQDETVISSSSITTSIASIEVPNKKER